MYYSLLGFGTTAIFVYIREHWRPLWIVYFLFTLVPTMDCVFLVNQVEYEALVVGIKLAIELGMNELEMRSDTQLVAR